MKITLLISQCFHPELDADLHLIGWPECVYAPHPVTRIVTEKADDDRLECLVEAVRHDGVRGFAWMPKSYLKIEEGL